MMFKAGLGALALAATLTSVALPASAEDGRNGALLGGLAAGALLGGAIASQPHYYGPSYAPAYTEYPAPYRRCWIARQRIYDQWGNFHGYRRVRTCD